MKYKYGDTIKITKPSSFYLNCSGIVMGYNSYGNYEVDITKDSNNNECRPKTFNVLEKEMTKV